jgi:hypothetical protein
MAQSCEQERDGSTRTGTGGGREKSEERTARWLCAFSPT